MLALGFLAMFSAFTSIVVVGFGIVRSDTSGARAMSVSPFLASSAIRLVGGSSLLFTRLDFENYIVRQDEMKGVMDEKMNMPSGFSSLGFDLRTSSPPLDTTMGVEGRSFSSTGTCAIFCMTS